MFSNHAGLGYILGVAVAEARVNVLIIDPVTNSVSLGLLGDKGGHSS